MKDDWLPAPTSSHGEVRRTSLCLPAMTNCQHVLCNLEFFFFFFFFLNSLHFRFLSFLSLHFWKLPQLNARAWPSGPGSREPHCLPRWAVFKDGAMAKLIKSNLCYAHQTYTTSIHKLCYIMFNIYLFGCCITSHRRQKKQHLVTSEPRWTSSPRPLLQARLGVSPQHR